MVATKFTVGLPNVSAKTLIGNINDYRSPPTQLDNSDFLPIISAGVVEIISLDRILTVEDAGKIFRSDFDIAINITIPANLPVGFNCAFARWNTGALNLTAGAGVTNRSAITAVSAQYKLASILVIKNNVGLTAAEYTAGEL